MVLTVMMKKLHLLNNTPNLTLEYKNHTLFTKTKIAKMDTLFMNKTANSSNNNNNNNNEKI